MWLRAASSNVSAASSPSAILGAPMESFLDRLLADERAAAPRPATQAAAAAAAPVTPPGHPGLDGELPGVPLGPEAPRIAIYDTLTSPPRVIAVEEKDLPALIASLAEKTYHYCREQGGQIPYTVLQELMENLLHACFRDVVVTIKMPAHAPEPEAAPRVPEVKLTTRQTKVLVLLMELGSSGPTAIAKELDISSATAFRELVVLQDMGLIHSLGDGKRALREEGLRLLESIL